MATTYTTTAAAPRSNMTLTFNDEFNGNTLPDGIGSVYNTVFPGNLRTLGSNGELQLYVDKGFVNSLGATPGYSPFSTGDGTLTITAKPTGADAANFNKFAYTSGMINTYDNVQFKYGYIEATAASELLSGSDGADTIFGGGGNDYIDGGVGANAMIGGQGNDTFVVDTTSDQIIESGVFAYC